MTAIGDEIAIVGIGCNFPGGEGIDNFWRVLEEGRNCTVEITPERFDTSDWYDPDDNKPGKICTTRAALIDGFNTFDNKLFGINDLEAERMDPQQKLLLECTYRALEDAGIVVDSTSGSKIGVFVGLMNRDYEVISSRAVTEINHYDGTGTAVSITANRISYTFNLTGPSLALDTACSSFLYALHYASHAVKQGDCEAALCGGVNCIIDPRTFVSLSKAKMISPEGISKPFSKKANGYGRGEGCGVLLLKPLKKALEDHNRIWGVINISAVNQSGRSVTPITRPSQTAQEKLLYSIYPTHVDPSVVQYIEAHGTGTAAGDPIEAESVGNVIGNKRSPKIPVLKIGSVKGNVGHAESAAGAAALIKVLLMMHHEKIVPSLHYREDISSINTEKLNLSIPTTVEKWEESEEFGRIAGVNCFGFGGTNAHVVVRQFKQTQVLPSFKRPLELFVLSAASSKSLKLIMEDTAEQLNMNNSVTLPSLVYTSACRRNHVNYRYRKSFITNSLRHLQQQVALAAKTEIIPSKANPQLVFVFCANGVNFKGISKTLLNSEPVFRDKCKEIEMLFQKYVPIRLLELIESECEDFSRAEIAQPFLFTLQVALVSLLKHWGIKPVAAVGHSVGEVAAAHCAGFLSLQDAVKVIYHRSRLQAKVTGGRMLVVGNIPVQEISEVLGPYSGKVGIAAFNSPYSCTLSGDADSVNALHKELTELFSKRGIFLRVLHVPAAYHSHMMDPIVKEMRETLQYLEKQKPEIEVISTLTGKAASEDDFTTGNFWARHAREPVAFTQAIVMSAKEKDNAVFVEIGPHRALQRYIVETLGTQTRVLSSLQIDKEYETLLSLAGNLFELGYNPDWNQFYEGYQSIPAAFPRYQFDHKKLMTYLDIHQQENKKTVNAKNSLICSVKNDNTEFNCTVSQALVPYLYEHKSNEVTLVPGAFFVELGLESLMSSSRPKVPLSTCQISINFLAPCVLNQNSQELKVTLTSEKTVTDFKILSSTAAVYASGQIIKKSEAAVEVNSISFQDIFLRCKSVVTADEVYEMLSQVGFQYGSMFRQLSDVFYSEALKEAITSIKVNRQTREEMSDYCIHPVLLDCFLQMTAVMTTITCQTRAGFPSGIGSLVVFRPLEEEMMIYLKTSKSTGNHLEVCGCFTDKRGSVLAELKRVGITFIKQTSTRENDFLFENKWKEIHLAHTLGSVGEAPRVIVFVDKLGVAQQLKKYLHNESRYVLYEDWETLLEAERLEMTAQEKMTRDIEDYHDVLFMWGIQKLNDEFPSKVVAHLAKCCEAYRQIIVALREKKSNCSIRIITYRTTERNVDHINPGFALCGMTRTCITEVSEITFQMIDVSSLSTLDISALADVIVKYKGQDHPEIWINHGRIYTSEIRRTPLEDVDYSQPSKSLQNSEMFTLYTTDPYQMKDLSAELESYTVTQLEKHSVEVQIEKVCVHSEDYFPVSVSSYTFGNTLYWNSHTIDKHKLLVLDFSGTVIATGSEVKKVKVGDQVVSCYPVVASSRVKVPGAVCFNIKKFPCFRNVPCVSYFMVAWEIFSQMLPKVRHNGTLGIISTEPDSVFCKVLNLTAREVGWRTIRAKPTADQWKCVNQCNALVYLPPIAGMPKELLASLSHLQDLVILQGNQESECFRYLTGSDQENVRVHVVKLISIFQKASLKQSLKAVYQWIKSMQMKQIRNLPFSIFQQTENFESTDSTSYFTSKSIPLAVLKDNVEPKRISDIPVYEVQKKMFKQNAVYIVAGGLTGLGFETVKFIAQNGGGSIAILSRSNPSNEKQEEIKALQNQFEGTKIVTLQCNIISRSQVEKAISSIDTIFSKSPIKGVFHSAVVLHDGRLEALNLSHFEKVLSPKVAGAINLHHATRGQELDCFVCYSSVTSFLGNSTQANYAAANSFLDVFCHYRRNCGLSGQSINWGALNLGLLLNKNYIQNILESKGIDILQIHEIYEYLKKSLLLNNPQQAVVKFNFGTLHTRILSQFPSLKSRFCTLISEEFGSKLDLSEQSTLQSLSPVNSEDYITSLVSYLSNTNVSDLTMKTSLASLGVDSVLAMTLQNRIFQERRVEIPLVKLLDPQMTISSLVLLLDEKSDENGILEKTAYVAEDTDDGSWL